MSTLQGRGAESLDPRLEDLPAIVSGCARESASGLLAEVVPLQREACSEQRDGQPPGAGGKERERDLEAAMSSYPEQGRASVVPLDDGAIDSQIELDPRLLGRQLDRDALGVPEPERAVLEELVIAQRDT